MKMRLTDMAVKKLSSPDAGQVTYWDKSTPGFGLRCSAKSKSFVVMFGEKRRLKTLGRYPAMSLSDARRQARLFLSEASFGKHQDTQISYHDAKDRFLKDCDNRLRPITVREYRRHLNFFAFKKDLRRIERSDVFAKLDELKATPTNQNYAFTALKVFFNWCVRNQFMTANPIVADKKPARLQSRERVLNEAELKALYGYVRSNRTLFHDMVALLILTGQRRTEIGHLRWDEIDEGNICLDASRTKNHRDHILPLSPTALHILQTRETNGPFVFPGKDPEKPFNGIRRVKTALDENVGIEHFTLHDLRRTLSSNMARLEVPLHVTEKILNHQSGSFGGVAGVYNRHNYHTEMAQALNQYDAYLGKLISP
jgi:integrase